MQEIFKFFFNNETKLSKRISWAIVLVGLTLLVDNVLSFSYYYNIEKKTTAIEKINSAIQDSTLNPREKVFLYDLRNEIIKRETIKEKAGKFLNESYYTLNAHLIENDEEGQNQLPYNKDLNEEKYRSPTAQYISSAWFYLLLMIILPITLFEKGNFINKLALIIVFEILLWGITHFLTFSFSYIPVILNTPIINYFLNAILCLLTALFIGKFNNWYKAKFPKTHKKYTPKT